MLRTKSLTASSVEGATTSYCHDVIITSLKLSRIVSHSQILSIILIAKATPIFLRIVYWCDLIHVGFSSFFVLFIFLRSFILSYVTLIGRHELLIRIKLLILSLGWSCTDEATPLLEIFHVHTIWILCIMYVYVVETHRIRLEYCPLRRIM